MQPDQLQSYHRWMHEHFFDHVNIPAESNPYSRRQRAADRRSKTIAASLKRQIERAGGIDVLLLGIGRNGHIGFNEPFQRHATAARGCARSTR